MVETIRVKEGRPKRTMSHLARWLFSYQENITADRRYY